jgi:hypothetical protein
MDPASCSLTLRAEFDDRAVAREILGALGVLARA